MAIKVEHEDNLQQFFYAFFLKTKAFNPKNKTACHSQRQLAAYTDVIVSEKNLGRQTNGKKEMPKQDSTKLA